MTVTVLLNKGWQRELRQSNLVTEAGYVMLRNLGRYPQSDDPFRQIHWQERTDVTTIRFVVWVPGEEPSYQAKMPLETCFPNATIEVILFDQKLKETLIQLHRSYGKGEIRGLHRYYENGGSLQCTLQYGEYYPVFNLRGDNNVSFCGQVRKIGYKPRG